MKTRELYIKLLTTVVEEWAKDHMFHSVTESLIINSLTRKLNDIFSFTIFVLMKHQKEFEVHFDCDNNNELEILKFKINYEY